MVNNDDETKRKQRIQEINSFIIILIGKGHSSKDITTFYHKYKNGEPDITGRVDIKIKGQVIKVFHEL